MSFGIPYGATFVGADGLSHKASISGERYVYYKRLATDGYETLFNKAVSVLEYRTDYVGGRPGEIAAYFANLRDGEFEKELSLLSKKFGMDISSSYDDENGDVVGADLIKAFNKILNLKEVYERNLALIKETNGQKQLITFFPEYFQKQWKDKASTILEQIRIASDNFTNLNEETTRSILYFWIPNLIRETLIHMFRDTRTENGISNGEKYEQAYRELLGPLNDIKNNLGNSFIQSFYNAYNVDDFIDSIIKQLSATQKTAWNIDNFSLTDSEIEMHTKGGLASENLANYITNYIFSNLGADAHSVITGGTRAKPDLIISTGFPVSIIEDWLKSDVFSEADSRERNVRAAKQLQGQLEQFDDGFIIYTNAKNYTLNDNFLKRGGFSAGKEITLQSWDTMMHIINKKGRDLIYSAMQLIPGAIGDTKKGQVSNMYARAIASALFDDFDTVGMVEKTGANSIHLLYLNGIYFPLSFFYNLLAEAFKEYSAASVADIVKVSFQIPTSILFKTQEEQSAWQKAHDGESAWNKQQQVALDNIKVSYYFLKAYKKIMSRLNLEDTF